MNSKRIMIGACFLSISFLYAMEQKEDVKINVGGQVYSLTREQASQSETLERLLKKRIDPEEAIVLPDGITSEIFEYIHKDLTNQNYDENDLDDTMMNQLLAGASILKIQQLIDKYSEVITDRLTNITIEVGNKEYVLSIAQAKKSNTLKNILADVEDYTLPIPLPNLSEEVFDYVYKDLTNRAYDSDSLSDEMLVDLINAANYLDSKKLLKKYQNLLVKHLKSIDSAEKLGEYVSLMQRLPEEMQLPLSQRVCDDAALIFKTLPQSEIKRILEREYSAYHMNISPDKTKLAALIDSDSKIIMVDLITNKKIWELASYSFSNNFYFSSDSLQLLIFNNYYNMQLVDAQTGIQVWQKNKLPRFKVLGFFSPIKRIIVESFDDNGNSMLFIDSKTGEIVFRLNLNNSRIGELYFDEEKKYLCFSNDENFVRTIDMMTGQEIKTKQNSESDLTRILPDGKKIITVSKELIKVENSVDDEDIFSWKLLNPLKNLPYTTVFSPDNRLITLLTENGVFVLDVTDGKIIWATSKIYETAYFSPDSYKLLLRNNGEFLCIDMDSKKKLWTRIFDNPIVRVSFISNVIISIIFEGVNPLTIAFCSSETGGTLTVFESSDFKKDRLDFKGIIGNNIMYQLSEMGTTGIVEKLLFFDISPVIIFSFLNQSYVLLDQALIVTYILNVIKNNKLVVIDDLLQFGYEDLPQEFKTLVEKHNKQWMSSQVEKTVKELKKLPRFKRRSRD